MITNKFTKLSQLTFLNPLLLNAPKTIMDEKNSLKLRTLHPRLLDFLENNVKGKPWDNHLTLTLLIMSARNFDINSMYSTASLLNNNIKFIFDDLSQTADFSIITMEDFNTQIDKCMNLYLKIKTRKNSKLSSLTFYNHYKSITILTREWLQSIDTDNREQYQSLLFTCPKDLFTCAEIDIAEQNRFIEEERQQQQIKLTEKQLRQKTENDAQIKKNEDKISQFPQLTTVDPLVLNAPQTFMDEKYAHESRALPQNVLNYLERHVKDKPWFSHLTLALLIMSARNFDESTIYSFGSLLHSKIKLFFENLPQSADFKIKTMEDFSTQIDKCMNLYLKERIGKDTKATRVSFYTRYKAVALLSREWLFSIHSTQRERYQSLLFTGPNDNLHQHLYDQKILNEEQQQRRKIAVDALMPIYPQLRSEAHLRCNFITRLWDAYKEALSKIDTKLTQIFPFKFQYSDMGRNFEFLIWNAASFLKNNSEASNSAENNTSHPTSPFLELRKVVEISNDQEIPLIEALWFAKPLLHNVFSKHSLTDEAIEWLNSWGYTKTSFSSYSPNLLYWTDNAFMMRAQKNAQGLLIPIEQFHTAMMFGLLAIDLFTTTGIRMNEAMQISLDPECLVRLQIPPPIGSKQETPTIRYTLRLIPKGQKINIRDDNFIGVETKHLLFKVAKMLVSHYELNSKDKLPSVPFDPLHRRSHRFGAAPYIFQFNKKHLSAITISSCIRLLLHNMALRASDGKIINIRPHLLRHGFATHAVQVEKIPIDIVGRWLHQKSVTTTEYYSRPTDSMVADAADQYLISIAAHIDVEKEVSRSPQDLLTIYEDAVNRTGTLAKVVGGDCASHGLCKSQLACIGCAAKIPDPAKRDQIIHQQEWAAKEIEFYSNEGLMPEVKRLEKLISDAQTELKEIELIEAYRQDEERIVKIKVINE